MPPTILGYSSLCLGAHCSGQPHARLTSSRLALCLVVCFAPSSRLLRCRRRFIFAAGATGGILWKMGNIMGSNDHYDMKMTGDGELATKDSKEAEKCALALYPITPFSRTPISARPPPHALLTPCTLFALVLSCFNAGSSAATLAPRASTTTSCIRRPRSSGPPPKVAVSR